MAVILQPTANKIAKEHFNITITNGVPLEIIREYVDEEDYEWLCEAYPDRIARVWGIKDGKLNVNKYDRIDYGDIVLFAADNEIFMSGKIILKNQNRELALRLWGTDLDNNAWKNMYFLTDLREQSVPYTIFNNVVGYDINARIQGFTVLDDRKSNLIINEFGLR